MTRASKTPVSPNDGMTWLALMPFPQFNPLNWWALHSPHNLMLASLNTTRLAMDAWRNGADSLRALARLQQNEALKLMEAHLIAQRDEREALAREESAPAETPAADSSVEATAALFMRPMMEATRAYQRAGRAFIVAQRDTLKAFTPEEKPH